MISFLESENYVNLNYQEISQQLMAIIELKRSVVLIRKLLEHAHRLETDDSEDDDGQIDDESTESYSRYSSSDD